MSCGCETYECMRVGIDTCNELVELPLIADATGRWGLQISSPNSQSSVAFDAVAGLRIVLPTVVFNENYSHKAVFTRPDGTVKDGCYNIETFPVRGITAPSPCPLPLPGSISITGIEGGTIADDRLIGRPIGFLIINDVYKASGFTHVGNTLTFTDGTTLNPADTLIIHFV